MPDASPRIISEIARLLGQAGNRSGVADLLGDSAGSVQRGTRASIEAAREQRSTGDIAAAADHACLAAITQPDNPYVRTCAEETLTANGTSVAFAHQLAGALDDPEDCQAWRRLGAVLRRDGKPNLAAAAYWRALSRDPRDGESLRSVAAILRDAAEVDAGLLLIRHALGIHPDDPWAHVQHGNLLARAGKITEAIDAFNHALDLSPGLPGVQTALGRQYLALGDLPGARAAFEAAVQDEPTRASALRELAELNALSGRHADAIVWYRRALAADPDSRTLRRNLAEALLRREFWREGRKTLRSVVPAEDERQPRWEGARYPRGKLVFHPGRRDTPASILLGLAVARAVADRGQHTVCVVDEAYRRHLAVTDGVPISFVGSMGEAETKRDGRAVAGYATYADVIALGQPAPWPAAPWMRAPGQRQWSSIRRVTFAPQDARPDRWPSMNALRRGVTQRLDMPSLVVAPVPGFEETSAMLEDVDLLVTDDAWTAIVAAAVGCPSVAVLPADAPWWWGDRDAASPWSARQTLVRVTPDFDEGTILGEIVQAVMANGRPPSVPELTRPGRIPQDVAEQLDRTSHVFEADGTTPESVTELLGGTRNKVFRVSGGGHERVLRLGRFPAPRKGFFAKEIANMTLAAKAGLAPRVDFTDPLDGAMLVGFVDGETMTSKKLNEVENAEAAARLFRRLHQVPGFRGGFDIFDKLDRNVRRLTREGSRRYLRHEKTHALIERVAAVLAANKVPHYATHNDPLTRNFVGRGPAMRLIDWECSGLGDPHWEVAAMAAQAGLGEESWHAYVTAYFGSDAHPGICRIPLYEAVCRYFWWTDALCDGLRNPDDAEWRDDARRWWGWFSAIADSDAFARALAAAEDYRWRPGHSPGSTDCDV